MKLSRLKYNPENPRRISPEQLDKLIKSIESLPKMMELRPIVYDPKTMHVLGGNQRLAALRKMGKTEIPDNWTKSTDEMTDKEKREFVLRDNVQAGEWDYSVLDENFADFDLDDIGIELPDFGGDDEPEAEPKEAGTKLTDRFIVPPFSVLDTRQGYWVERKRVWHKLIGDNGESRSHAASFNPIKYKSNPRLDLPVSVLDPVIAELACRWFCVDEGNTFDPFAGDTVFGYVAATMGHRFTGIELRQEQCDINNERTANLNAKYICDDGQNIAKHISGGSQDLLFSCPPYYDLEVYSGLPNDASNQQSYKDFIKIIKNALAHSIKCLKNNRFAFIVVGDIRDKTGAYRQLPGDIRSIFTENGMMLYNDMVLVEQSGSLAIRVGKYMVSRKVGKCHQNVLVFYKGDPKEIKNHFKEIDFEDAINVGEDLDT